MTRRFLATIATVAALSLPLPSRLHAQQPAGPDFRPLEFLVGHCWIGTFPGTSKTDEHCFEWVFDHKFIRDRHVVRNAEGPYQGETLYGWDAKEKRLGFWYWNSEGQIMLGTVQYTPEGIVFPLRMETPTGATELKAVWTRLGTGGYRVWNGRLEGAEWKTMWTMEMTQKP